MEKILNQAGGRNSAENNENHDEYIEKVVLDEENVDLEEEKSSKTKKFVDPEIPPPKIPQEGITSTARILRKTFGGSKSSQASKD